MEKTVERGPDWMGLPVIATVTRLLCRELALQNECLRLEIRVLRDRIPGRIRFTDEERRSLADAALAMNRSLVEEVVNVVKPETIVAWQRRLERNKWDCSECLQQGPGRPRTPADIEAFVCRMAREKEWGYQCISGELLKPGIKCPKGCVSDVLLRNGIAPSPQLKGLTWLEFLARHAEVLLRPELFRWLGALECPTCGPGRRRGLALPT